MLNDELTKVKATEDKAEEIKKNAILKAKEIRSKAKEDAEKIVALAKEEAENEFGKLVSEAKNISDKEYEDELLKEKARLEEMAKTLDEKKKDAVKFVKERAVK